MSVQKKRAYLLKVTKNVAYWGHKAAMNPEDTDFLDTYLFWQNELHDTLHMDDFRDLVDAYPSLTN